MTRTGQTIIDTLVAALARVMPSQPDSDRPRRPQPAPELPPSLRRDVGLPEKVDPPPPRHINPPI